MRRLPAIIIEASPAEPFSAGSVFSARTRGAMSAGHRALQSKDVRSLRFLRGPGRMRPWQQSDDGGAQQEFCATSNKLIHEKLSALQPT